MSEQRIRELADRAALEWFDLDEGTLNDVMADAIRTAWREAHAAGVAQERERAAKICEDEAEKSSTDWVEEQILLLMAQRIREGGE